MERDLASSASFPRYPHQAGLSPARSLGLNPGLPREGVTETQELESSLPPRVYICRKLDHKWSRQSLTQVVKYGMQTTYPGTEPLGHPPAPPRGGLMCFHLLAKEMLKPSMGLLGQP